jgi:hypothetical protein
VCLYSKLCENSKYSLKDFALGQINGATSYYRNCFVECISINAHFTLNCGIVLHRELIELIKKVLSAKVGIAFDEAQIMASKYRNMYVKRCII